MLRIFNGKPAVLLMITRQPDANIIETVDRIKALIPALQASIPSGINMQVSSDRSVTIRASLREVEPTLLLSVVAGDDGRFSFPSGCACHSDSRGRGAGFP